MPKQYFKHFSTQTILINLITFSLIVILTGTLIEAWTGNWTGARAQTMTINKVADNNVSELENPSHIGIPKVIEAFNLRQTSIATMPIHGDTYFGSPDAKVVLIEFSDFNCASCARFHSDILPELTSQFIDKNQIAFVYKNIVGVGGAVSAKAALASECMREQMDDTLHFKILNDVYAHQGRRNVDLLFNLAKEHHLDLESLTICTKERHYRPAINEDMDDAMSVNIAATPSFMLGYKDEDNIVKGVVIQGAPSYELFAERISVFINALN